MASGFYQACNFAAKKNIVAIESTQPWKTAEQRLMGCAEHRALFDRKFKIVRIGWF